jgi:hypothetical protein
MGIGITISKLSCRVEGHRWDGGADRRDGSTPVCSRCGAAGQSADSPVTLIYAPKHLRV